MLNSAQIHKCLVEDGGGQPFAPSATNANAGVRVGKDTWGSSRRQAASLAGGGGRRAYVGRPRGLGLAGDEDEEEDSGRVPLLLRPSSCAGPLAGAVFFLPPPVLAALLPSATRRESVQSWRV